MKDDNKAVNDIFQNDNGSKNKTKTILLLTIVAIILISVFLIIAWVMTRDNPLQDMQNQTMKDQNKNGLALNEPKDKTLPYAHNLDSQNPLGLDTNRDSLKPQENETQADSPMSNVPPLGVPANTAPMPTTSTKPSKDDDLENDVRFQAALRDLEKQHNDKKNIDKTTESKKEESKKEEPKKVITPIPPKDTTIAIAPDPTKSTQKPKDSDKDSKKPQADSKKQESQKAEPKKPEQKKQEPAKTESTKPKDSEKETKKPNDNIIPKPQNNVVSANQGKSPEQGYYLQVGVFTQTPAQSFLNKIAKYNYRVLKTEEDGVTKSKYLIGPYISKNKAKEAEQKVREEVESKANVIFYQRQAK